MQDADARTDQLHHRRAALPERSALADVRRSLAEVDAGSAERRERAEEVARLMKRGEDEVAVNEARAASLEAAMRSGASRSARDVSAMAAEVEGLRRRVRIVEDGLLERMEEAEARSAELAELDGRRAALVDDAQRLAAQLADAEAAIDGELSEVGAGRAELAGQVGPDLLTTYESLRRRLDGVAVARLDGNRCSGCHLTLSATELDVIRRAAPSTIVRHDECGRILVPAS